MGTPAEKNAMDNLDSNICPVERDFQAFSRIGARMVVLCKFVDAVLPQLTAAQCMQIGGLFRLGVEEAMARTDDIVMPGAYHSTLLEQTNVLLTAMRKKGAI